MLVPSEIEMTRDVTGQREILDEQSWVDRETSRHVEWSDTLLPMSAVSRGNCWHHGEDNPTSSKLVRSRSKFPHDVVGIPDLQSGRLQSIEELVRTNTIQSM